MSEDRSQEYDLFFQEIPSADYFSEFETDIEDCTEIEVQPSLSESQVSQLTEDTLHPSDSSTSKHSSSDYGGAAGFEEVS